MRSFLVVLALLALAGCSEPEAEADWTWPDLDTLAVDLPDTLGFSPFITLAHTGGRLASAYIRCSAVVYVDTTWPRIPESYLSDDVMPLVIDTAFVCPR